jgi:hypothetical protein
MSLPSGGSTHRKYRATVDLPVDLLEQLNATIARRGGPTVACLLYGWIVSAARIARMGNGNLLPPGGRSRRGSVGPVLAAAWTQGRSEYEDCARALDTAGSSVTAVLRAAARQYVACAGDPLAMAWPSETVPLQPA